MPRSKPMPLEDYEMKDPVWWLQQHKNSLGYLCIRADQLLEAMETNNVEDVVTYSKLLKVILATLNEKGIGVYDKLEEE